MSAAAVALLLAAAPSVRSLAVDPAASVVRFHVNHKLHAVDGRSTAIEGKALVGDDGTVRAMVRIPVSSFESGDANRDANMRETLEVSRHPYVVLKAAGRIDAAAPRGRPVETTLDGELDFHGVRRPVAVPLSVTFLPDGGARIAGRMTLSLDSYAIERPSLLFVKLDDGCTVDVDLVLRGAP